MSATYTFMEFFAGGGMARLGLGTNWRCLLANDFDSQKCAAYRANFGGEELIEGPIEDLDASDLPRDRADLVWASFPCQDLSLAGARGGMAGARSGAFFSFWSHVERLVADGRRPSMIAIENVVGLLTSNGGRDFQTLIAMMAKAGFAVSALVVDAKHFTPQSRPRIFIFGFGDGTPEILHATPDESAFTPAALLAGVAALPAEARENWGWLAARPQTRKNMTLADILDWSAADWRPKAETARLVDMMSDKGRARLDALLRNKARRAGAAFRRTRMEDGAPVQRLEARFDGLAGCLRTPAGGSSRQIVLAVENGAVRSRLLSPREAARLMGLPDDYHLPASATAALKLCGDGVCVSVVRWITEAILEPALARARNKKAA